MSGFQARQSVPRLVPHVPPAAVQQGSSTKAVEYAIGGVVFWLVGIQFFAGWHFATLGSPEYGRSVLQGLFAVVLAAVCTVALRLAGARPVRASGFWVAMAVALVFIFAAFPVGAILACFENAIWGSYPDMSGLGNRMIEMIL